MFFPGFGSCGFKPRPSSGVNGSRSNGLAEKSIVIRKNPTTTLVIPATYGSRASWRRLVMLWAAAPQMERITAQKSRVPFCPAQNAATTYEVGRLREVYWATYSMLKSCARRPFHWQSAATTRAAHTPWGERPAVAARSGRSCHRPKNATPAPHAAAKRASQSVNCPRRVTASRLARLLQLGLVAGSALGQDFGGVEHAVPAVLPLDDDLDVAGVGEGVGDETGVGHREFARPVGHPEGDGASEFPVTYTGLV